MRILKYPNFSSTSSLLVVANSQLKLTGFLWYSMHINMVAGAWMWWMHDA
jgi:hypothetical protein